MRKDKYVDKMQASLELLDRITQRLESEAGWDQAIFNGKCLEEAPWFIS